MNSKFPTAEQFLQIDINRKIPIELQSNYADIIAHIRGGFYLGLEYSKKKTEFEKEVDVKKNPASI
jgi:hypothetical protein